ncbi:MAG: GGDEF domain-containing protein [Sulfurospirillum sp.]
MNKKLHELTDETIKEIRKLDIVLPEIYNDIFYTKANDLGIKINEKEKKKALIYAMNKIQKMKDETEKSTTLLKTNIQKARTAIVEKNDNDLKMIEEAVISLERKIIHLQEDLYIDELTRLYNRRWLYEKYLDLEKFKYSGVFAFVDIDSFKSVNDNYGHLTGDKVLAMIGSLLRKVEDTFAIRFAGDEFILISENHDKNKLTKLLEAIRRNLEATNLKHENKTFNITFSFGIVDFKEKNNFKEIFKNVDSLMYKDKKQQLIRSVQKY